MSNLLDVREFLAGFLAEAEDHLRSAGQNLLALDASFAQGQSNPRAVREGYLEEVRTFLETTRRALRDDDVEYLLTRTDEPQADTAPKPRQ